jgi:hypothetical protein
MRFQPGQSGNPAGRPAGSRNQKTLEMEDMLADRAEAAVTKILDRAETGDPAAMRLCMDRVLPTGANRPLALELPPVKTPDDVTAAAGVVVKALGEGAISPRETVHLLTVVERLARIAERVQQMKERHAAWREAPPPGSEADASLAAFAKQAAKAALKAALEEEGLDDPRLYSPVDSAAAAPAEATAAAVANAPASKAAPAGSEGDGLYSPVNSGDAALLDALSAAGERAGRAGARPSGGVLHRRRRELMGTVAESLVPGRAIAYGVAAPLHLSP